MVLGAGVEECARATPLGELQSRGGGEGPRRLTLLHQIVLIAAVAVALAVAWVSLDLHARAELDSLLADQATITRQEAALASLDLELMRARVEEHQLIATRREAHLERFDEHVRQAGLQVRALIDAAEDPRLATLLSPIHDGLARYDEAVSAHPTTLEDMTHSELELEHAVDRARLEYEGLAPPVEAARALLERSSVTAAADVRALRHAHARRIAALFSLAFFISVIFLLWQVRRAQRFNRRVRRLSATMRDLAENGFSRLDEVEREVVLASDELGALFEGFYAMLDVFEELAGAARAVAEGDLSVEIVGPGELPEAFRAMVDRLAAMVKQIRLAAFDVASVAQEIHAASLLQEDAAGKQSVGVQEVSVALERLSEAAGNIAGSAGDVLINAEQTRVHADELASRLGELGSHVERIGELLELIREVADRSDLIALNGSLEATRAGDAGRGFSLVASEMRRLAERVTGAVADVRSTVTAIDESSAATRAATRQSRELAESTAEVAQVIYGVTEVQSADTKKISDGVRGLATVVGSTATSISQTRAAAAGLRERAQLLERLTTHFELGAQEESQQGTSTADET